jgi:hypothetical protein
MYEIKVGGVTILQGEDLDKLVAEAQDSLHENAQADVWLRGLYVGYLERTKGEVRMHWTGD